VNWTLYFLTIAAGLSNPAQGGANAQLYKTTGTALWTAFIVYSTGLLAIVGLLAINRVPLPEYRSLSQVPWWAWGGGLLSVGSTLVGTAYAQKLGSGVFTGLLITASVLSSIAFDHFGLLGFELHAATPLRIAGGVLMTVGLWMVAKS